MFKLKSNKILFTLLLSFLAAALAPLFIQVWLNYKIIQEAIHNETIAHLKSLSLRQASQIEGRVKKLMEGAALFTQRDEVTGAVKNSEDVYGTFGKTSPEYRKLEQALRSLFKGFPETLEYENFHLISSSGVLLFSAEDKGYVGFNLLKGDLQVSGLALSVKESMNKKEMVISRFEYSESKQYPAAFLSSPVVEGGQIAGAVAFELNSAEFSAMVHNYTGLGRTGEIMLGAQDGESVVYMFPRRFDPQGHRITAVPMGEAQGSVVMQKAILGQEGSGFAADYRGQEVLAVWKHFPKMGWGMAVKIDKAEIFAPLKKMRNGALLLGIITLIAVSGFAVWITRLASKPIKFLTQKMRLVSGGDLEQKIDVFPNDELGDLAASFNEMVDRWDQTFSELKRDNDEIMRSNKELAEFAYVVSHDLKEPLRGIYNYSNFLLEDYGEILDKAGKEKLETIVRLSKRQESLIEDILKYSQVDRLKMVMDSTDLDLAVHEVLRSLGPELEKNNIKIKKLPRFPAVVCDKFRVEKVFLNLIANAMKYNDKDYKWVEIGFTKRRLLGENALFGSSKGDNHGKDNQVVYYVRDNGIGIPKEYHEMIFGIFKRLHSRNKFGGGTGAGLAIAKKIVERHKGEIWLHSLPGKETTFYFTLDEGE